MNNKSAGFSLIELLLVIVVIGVLVTIAIPSFFGHLAGARDAERLRTIQQSARLILLNGERDSSVLYDLSPAVLTGVLADGGIKIENTGPSNCYVYGHRGNAFFLAVQSEKKPGTFVIDGNQAGKTDFSTQSGLQLEMEDCMPLTAPTIANGYNVYYVP